MFTCGGARASVGGGLKLRAGFLGWSEVGYGLDRSLWTDPWTILMSWPGLGIRPARADIHDQNWRSQKKG